MRSRGSTALRRAGRRLAAVLLGLLAAFALIEGALWLASLFARPEDRLAQLAPRPGERRILCVGDSNTYGIYLEPEASYPAQLEGLLDVEAGNPWRVVNLGYPGQNSAQVRGRLAENIALYRPEIVIAWIGINNSWSEAMGHLWEVPDGEPPPDLLHRLVQNCRTFGMLRMLRVRLLRALDPAKDLLPGRDAVPGLDGAVRGEGIGDVEQFGLHPDLDHGPSDLRRGLAIDLRRLRAICAAHGATLVLVTYPIQVPFVLEKVNPTIREVAQATAAPLVDLERDLVPILSRFEQGKLLFPDLHATALGNYEVARLVLARLVAAELLDRRPRWTDVPELGARLTTFELLLRSRTGRVVELDLLGAPGAAFRIVLDARFEDDAGQALPPRRVPLRERSGLDLEEQRNYLGRIAPHGAGRVRFVLPESRIAPELAGESVGRFVGWRVTALAAGVLEGDLPSIDLPLEADPRR
jgi:lysophospholipase L1-like esterase